MQYNQLITDIQADIYSNGAELITGDILQNVLVAMVGGLAAAGACYKGVITTSSAAPADLDQATVYLALTAGTYTNFVDSSNNPIVTTGPALIIYNGGAQLVFSKTDLPFAEKGIEISVAAGKYLVINDPFATNSLLVEAIGGSGTKQLLLGNYPWGGNEVECRDINGFADYIVEEYNGGTTAKWLFHDEGLGTSVLHFDYAATVYIHVLAGTLSGYSVEDSNPISPDSTSINLEDVLLVTKSELPWKATVTPDEPYLDIFLNGGCVLAIDSVGDNAFHGVICVSNVEEITSAVYVGTADIDTSVDVKIGHTSDNELVLEIVTSAPSSDTVTVTCLNGTAPDSLEENSSSQISILSETHPWTDLEAGGGSAEITSNKKTDIASNRTSETYYPNTKGVFDLTSKWGVISQTQMWANDYGTYTLSDVTYGAIPKEFIDRWNAAVVDFGGTFNESSGYFELNGLTDLSYQDALRIYNIKCAPCAASRVTDYIAPMSTALSSYNTFKARTVIPCVTTGTNMHRLTWNTYIEVTKFRISTTYASSFASPTNYVHGQYRLRKMLDVYSVTSALTLNLFYALQECYFIVSANVTASDSKYLSLASVVYMVENAANTSAITITLHATAYARCQADTTEYTYGGQTYTGIIAYANARNITIASA